MDLSLETVNIHDAKTHLSRIVEEVKTFGKPMIIAKSGKPQVKIVPLDEPVNKSRFGFLQHKKVAIPDEFDRLNEDEIADLFEGKTS